MKDSIEIKGACEHNLKGLDISIPRDKLVVITGVSGSGKSTLAFDTLYAEGQRRYVESLSAYARQFLDQMPKPQVDSIEGLSPAIAIEQKTTSNNPRSTVGTVTEIYDYLRVLYARVGTPRCFQCGRPIESLTVQQMVAAVSALGEGRKVIVYAPVISGRKGEYAKLFDNLARDGFVRVRVDAQTYDLTEVPPLDKQKKHTIEVVVDRVVLKEGVTSRLNDSIEMACKLSGGQVLIEADQDFKQLYSEHNSCPVCNLSFPEIEPRLFSFNNPHGACATCGGLGALLEFDPELIVPRPELSVMEGAIAPWGVPPGRFAERMIERLRYTLGFDPYRPYAELTPEIKRVILRGGAGFEGVIPNLTRRLKESEGGEIHEYLTEYLSYRVCPECGGSRLKREALSVMIGGLNIAELTALSVDDMLAFFKKLELGGAKLEIAGRLLKEITERLGFLSAVGIGYLSLSRQAGTLSSGEAQRIRLATQIGSALMGVMYILDEPSVGLHQRDNVRLINTLKHLRDLGNTVIVVEHDDNTMLASDQIIDMGPGAGELGGEVTFQGTPEEILKSETSLTGLYLSGRATHSPPRTTPRSRPEALFGRARRYAQ